ncbi:MAG: alpha/beta hydrolase-fold protein [Myxococcota bacterium]|nr:alpha/beta hydrolase-fold protein [Myxococcota bacterium]
MRIQSGKFGHLSGQQRMRRAASEVLFLALMGCAGSEALSPAFPENANRAVSRAGSQADQSLEIIDKDASVSQRQAQRDAETMVFIDASRSVSAGGRVVMTTATGPTDMDAATALPPRDNSSEVSQRIDGSPPGIDTERDATDVLSVDAGASHGQINAILATLRRDYDAGMSAYAQTDGWPLVLPGGVVLVVTNSGLPKVAGDHDGWAGTPLTVEEDFGWALLPNIAGAGYKFTDGHRWAADPWSRAYGFDEHGEMSFVHGQGDHLERWFGVQGVGIAARTIRVWVPAQPVRCTLYMHDGQNLFDPYAPWGGWRLQRSIPDGMMVVGIDNTVHRGWEYTHVPDIIDGQETGGGAGVYAQFLETVVRPFINHQYGEADTVGTMGSSLGGLVSLFIAQRQPEAYDFVGVMSGTLAWGRIGGHSETMIERIRSAPPSGVAVYLDSGGPQVACADGDGDGIEDGAPGHRDNYCPTKQLAALLLRLGWDTHQNFWYRHAPDALHNEAAWADRVAVPLQIFAEHAQ